MTTSGGSRQDRLLHRGAAPGTWANLGCWTASQTYPEACEALADRVAEAAGLQPGAHVLGLACGAGDELLRWIRRFGVAAVTGVELDAARLSRAVALLGREAEATPARLLAGDAGRLLARRARGLAGPFDAVTCVDAIYHLPSRTRLAAQVLALLRPGGRFAFTDLVLPVPAPSPGIRAAARLCGVPPGELLDVASREAQLRAAGFVDVRSERLDDAVLGGFAAFVRRQERVIGAARWHPAWWRVAVTARLVGPCRAAGVGYALFSARRP